jgi:uncharacterized damage-inducible protein DinB
MDMSSVEHVRRLQRWDQWANRLTLDSMRDVEDEGYSLRMFDHILKAQQAWLMRLRGQDSSKVSIWAEGDFDDCVKRVDSLAAELTQYLDGLSDNDMDGTISYSNQGSESLESRRFDILVHLLTHSHYHRGQIAASVRRAGGQPAKTDFIFGVRQYII